MANEKSGDGVSYRDFSFDDSGWRTVELPHDWGNEGPFDQALSGETGKLPWAGVGWYRKHFVAPRLDGGRRITLQFDGAMENVLVLCNGISASTTITNDAAGSSHSQNPPRYRTTPTANCRGRVRRAIPRK